MNPHDDPLLPFDDPASENAWLAQEQAMRRERLPLDAHTDDAHVRRYRLLARALQQPLAHQLPADFAARTAALARRAAPRASRAGTRFEFVLMIALAWLLVAAAAAVSVLYGGSWLAALPALVPPRDPGAARWLLAFSGCVAVSLVLEWWQGGRRRRG